MALPIYPANASASFDVPLTDAAGNPVTVSSVEWSVFDEDGNTLNTTPYMVAVSPGDTTVAITVPALLNVPAAGQVRGVRVISAEFVGAGVSTTVSYMIERDTALVVMTNSFQTYERVLVTRAELGQPLFAFDSATKGRQIAALETAYRKLGRLHYKFPLDGDGMDYLAWEEESDGTCVTYRVVRDIGVLSVNDFNEFPERFKSALRRAQIVEANAILGGDPLTEKRMAGIVSETIGESSMFLNNKMPLSLPVSRAAFAELSGFVYRRFAVSRA